MNNQGGWGFKNVFAIIAVLAAAILIAMITYNRSFSELFGAIDEDADNITYQTLENRLIRAAKTYTDNYYYKPLEEGDEDYVSVNTLIDNGVMNELEDVEDKNTTCTGYVHFYKEEGTATYEPYLKCGDNYKTPNYSSAYDE